jgi:glycosyltransferase involved in cell wall biosynthesis
MKTVVHYTDTIAFGGAEKMLLTLVENLPQNRWRSILFCHAQPGIQRLLDGAARLGVETVSLPPLTKEGATAAPTQFIGALRSRRPDLFHAHLTWRLRCSSGLSAAFLARVPCRVATQQLFVRDKHLSFRYRQRAISMIVDRYVAVSNAIASELTAAGVSPRKINVVYNGINIDRFKRRTDSSVRAVLTNGDRRPLVLTLARLHWQKGLRHLVDAASRIPDAVFAVAGDGEDRTHLEDAVNRLGLANRFHLLGHREDIPELLAACDVFVLPSLFEGLPVSVLEAMAAEKPVIATVIGGTDEAVVDGETGLLVPPNDPNALTAAIRRLIESPSLSSRLAAAGRARVQGRFSAASMTTGIEHVYQQLLHTESK